MVRFRELPDLEAVAAEWLRDGNLPEIARRWYSSIPASPTYPLGTIKRIGGTPVVREALDTATLQIDVWGETKSQARDIAAKARVRLLELEGQSVTDPVTAFVTAVEEALGLTWQPDPSTSKDRYLFSMIIFAH